MKAYLNAAISRAAQLGSTVATKSQPYRDALSSKISSLSTQISSLELGRYVSKLNKRQVKIAGIGAVSVLCLVALYRKEVVGKIVNGASNLISKLKPAAKKEDEKKASDSDQNTGSVQTANKEELPQEQMQKQIRAAVDARLAESRAHSVSDWLCLDARTNSFVMGRGADRTELANILISTQPGSKATDIRFPKGGIREDVKAAILAELSQ